MEPVRTGNEVAGTPRARPQLSAQGVAVLYGALREAVGEPDPMSSSRLKKALEHICADAKRDHWPPESLLVAFKSALDTVPGVRLTPGPGRDAFVARLVSMCIDQYYADHPR